MDSKRPLSAIFLGDGERAPGTLSQLQTSNSGAVGGSGLPSPPATNSTASTGKESLPKRVRKTSIAFATVKSMLTGERVRKQRHDDDDELIEDEDHTARLSGPTASNSSDGNDSIILGRSTSIGGRSTNSGHDRVKSLADRNRMVLDKLSSISSAASSRLNSPAPNDRVPLTASTLRSRAVSPMPPTSNTLFPPKSGASASGLSPRGSHASLSSPNGRYGRDLEPETPSFSSRVQSSDKQIRDSEESTTPKDRERLYASQRAPPSAYTVSTDGSASGMRREGSVRVSFSRSRQEMDVDEFGVNRSSQAQSLSQSQSRQRAYSSESDDRSITPPADASRRLAVEQTSGGRGRRISINEPNVSPTKPREPMRTRAAAGTLGRQRTSAEVIERTVAAARKSPVRTRGALPSEFRSNTESKRSSWDGKRFSLDGKRTYSRGANSPELRRDSGNRPSPAAGSRAATVRETSRRTHSRWASEDVSGDGNDNGNGRPRYDRRGGSIESPIIPGGRSVVGESLKAAGITTRRDMNEPNGRLVDNRDSIDWEVEQLRNGIARVGVGDDRIHEEEDDDEGEEENTTPGKRATGHPVQTIITSRPGTSNGDYVDDGPRTAPPALRQYRSNTGLMTPSGSGTVRERAATPVTPAMLVSAASTEHIRLMLESFAMFESSLARQEASNPGGGVSELLQNADVVVQASQSLNRMLRESAARALSEQIESEVEDRDSREVEIWRIASAEFRDAVKVCDELVRSMTNLLLGVGRVVKDHNDEPGRSGRVSTSGRISADGARTGRMSTEGVRSGRMSADGSTRSGRMSAEGLRPNRLIEDDRRNVETRRSLDGEAWISSSREPTRLHDPLRPQTSMSLIREQRRDSPLDTNPLRQSTSRRFFPSQTSSPAAGPSDGDMSFGTDSYETPSPATRHMPHNGEHHRERMLSVAPTLSAIPSESLVPQASKTPAMTRRPRISVGTVRASAPFPTPTTAPAPTQLSTATALGNGSPEKRSASYTVSRRSGGVAAMVGLGHQHHARKRTISAADPMDPEVTSPVDDIDEGSPTQRITTRNPRASVEFSLDEGTVNGLERERKGRRRATELFS
ncbi:hypothetical protein FRC11_012817 [Ceratobasidium sp. 423]|nr:hypothetical protein FRC11_012817 [Ceratobasidium sp. 423]